MSAWTCRSSDGKAVVKIVPPRLRIPLWKGPGADSEEKHEPASDIDTVAVDSLKALDPQWPIREEKRTWRRPAMYVCFGWQSRHQPAIAEQSRFMSTRPSKSPERTSVPGSG